MAAMLRAWLRSALTWLLVPGLFCCAEPTPSGFCAFEPGDSPTRGPESAWVTLVEFADFECPYCGMLEEALAEVTAMRAEQLRLVYKHTPLTSIHPHALAASLAAVCADAQDEFFAMHDLLYQQENGLSDAALRGYASELGLDLEAFELCLEQTASLAVIERDLTLARDIGLSGVPTLFINGKRTVGSRSASELLEQVDEALKEAEASGLAPADYYQTLVERGCS